MHKERENRKNEDQSMKTERKKEEEEMKSKKIHLMKRLTLRFIKKPHSQRVSSCAGKTIVLTQINNENFLLKGQTKVECATN